LSDSQHNLLTPGFDLTLRPMKYPQFYDAFVKAQDNNWTVQEISFGTDIADLREKLTPGERHIVSRLVAFFATGDSIVGNNAALTLYKHVNSPEARLYYSRQIYEEALHVQFYLTLLDNYVTDHAERAEMFDAINNIPSVKAKAEWTFKWMDQMNAIDIIETDEQRKTFLMNLLAFTMGVEGLFFYAAFAYVYYLRDRGLLHGLASGTNWVFRDESWHMRFGFMIVDTIRKEMPHLWDADMEARVYAMVEEAIRCEMMFAEDVLSVGAMGLSLKDMEEYLRFVADGHLRRLGMAPAYNATCPFDFMLKQDVQALTSFFERTVAEYTVGIGGEVDLKVEDW
jgi:ribonucleoside-diphosphate reductase beta chain